MGDSGEFYEDPGYYEHKFQCAVQDLGLESLGCVYAVLQGWLIEKLSKMEVHSNRQELKDKLKEIKHCLTCEITDCEELVKSINRHLESIEEK